LEHGTRIKVKHIYMIYISFRSIFNPDLKIQVNVNYFQRPFVRINDFYELMIKNFFEQKFLYYSLNDYIIKKTCQIVL